MSPPGGYSPAMTRQRRRTRHEISLLIGNVEPNSGVYGKFRGGRSFVGRARPDNDPEAFERLLAAFGRRYPSEWDRWEPRFRKGFADGSRVLLRYLPTGGAQGGDAAP